MRYFLIYALLFVFIVLIFETGRLVGFTEAVQLLGVLPHD